MGLVKGGDLKQKTYLNINGKRGVFVESVKNEGTGAYEYIDAPARTTLTGFLTKLTVVSHESKTTQKLKYSLRMEFDDPDPKGIPMVVEAALWRQSQDSDDQSVGETTGFGLKILAALNACDLKQPMTLMPWAMAKGEAMADGKERDRDGTGVSFRQGGAKIVPVFLLEGKPVDKLPPLPSQVFAGKTLYDKASWAVAAEELRAAVIAKLAALTEHELPGQEEDEINPVEAAAAANETRERQRA